MEQNLLGHTRAEYAGGKSTLCTGCGHDSVTAHIISALFQSSVNPYQVAKMSGIGCSSKTTNYFLDRSHGFNSIHGRMAPVATGAKVVARDLLTLGVSGDGDTASIGLGSFIHLIRRNVPMVYIIENNGVYGLTKGQFSATADAGSRIKSGVSNPFMSVDICTLALDAGCSFVARSFSGDAKQLVPLLDAAFRHTGTAVIDVISPCITFANHEGSTKSYDAVRGHNVHLQELGFIQPQAEIKADYEEGSTKEVTLPDGSILLLKKIDSMDHDITDADSALVKLRTARQKGEILTGLFYWDRDKPNLLDHLKLPEIQLRDLDESQLRMSDDQLKSILADFR